MCLICIYDYKLGNRPDVTNNAKMCKDSVEVGYMSINGKSADLSDYNKMIYRINTVVAQRESDFKTNRYLQSKIRSRLDNLGASYSSITTSE